MDNLWLAGIIIASLVISGAIAWPKRPSSDEESRDWEWRVKVTHDVTLACSQVFGALLILACLVFVVKAVCGG